jgi:hypothetical protein
MSIFDETEESQEKSGRGIAKKADPDAAERAEAEAIGLSLEEFREVKAAQARLWPLGQ